MDFDLTGLFTAPGAIAGGAAVAGVTQVVKGLVFPAHWTTGRAPMILAALLASALVIAAEQVAAAPVDAGRIVTDVLTWASVYTAAIGTHQTLQKVGTVAAGENVPGAPDDAPRR